MEGYVEHRAKDMHRSFEREMEEQLDDDLISGV